MNRQVVLLSVMLSLVVFACGRPTLSLPPARLRSLGSPTAASAHGPNDTDVAWSEMNRVLQGPWRATTDDNRIINTSYRTVSKGSALVETFTTASGKETLTVYHRDGNALMLTHYCAQGNQARLKATLATREKVVFEFLDATNVQADQGVMKTLVFTFRPDGFDQESVYRAADKLETTTLHFVHAPPKVGEVTRIDAELAVRTVAPDVFVVTHEPFSAANVLVVRMPDGTVVLCSSRYETQATRALVRWVHGALAPARVVAINTHFHFDGTGGNEAYRELGVVTYASEHTQKLLAENGQRLQTEWAADFDDSDKRRRVETMKIVPAEKTFPERDGLVLAFGSEEVRVVYPGAAHSPDNVLVFFPSKGLLFGGCMIKASRSIGYVGHADFEHWESAVEVARALGARVVVPGHGAVSGPDLFDLTVSIVRDAKAKGHK